MTSLELMTEEVQVWVASLEVPDARYAELHELCPAKRKDVPKAWFRFSRGGSSWRAGFFVPCCPASRAPPPGSSASLLGTSGKPSLADHDIHFNISHSAELGLFAFAPDRPVGVDVENERPVRRLLDVAQRFMSEDEIRSLAATAPEVAGYGIPEIVGGADEAQLEGGGKGRVVRIGGREGAAGLTHKLFAPRPGYIAAVAASDSDWRLYTCAMKE